MTLPMLNVTDEKLLLTVNHVRVSFENCESERAFISHTQMSRVEDGRDAAREARAESVRVLTHKAAVLGRSVHNNEAPTESSKPERRAELAGPVHEHLVHRA